MYLSESLQKKWEGVLDHPDLPKIEDKYKKVVNVWFLRAKKAGRNGEVWSSSFRAVPTNSGFSR